MRFGTLEAQAEYVQAMKLGYGFTNHNKWWHWMYPLEMINPEDRARLEKEFPGTEFFIWSVNTYRHTQEVIVTPIKKGELLDWTQRARRVAAENGGE